MIENKCRKTKDGKKEYLDGLTMPLTSWSILRVLFFDGANPTIPTIACHYQTNTENFGCEEGKTNWHLNRTSRLQFQITTRFYIVITGISGPI